MIGSQLTVAEQKYPRFAQELNAELSQLPAQSQATNSASAADSPALAVAAPKLSGRRHHAAVLRPAVKRHPKQHAHKLHKPALRHPHLRHPRHGLPSGSLVLRPFTSQNPTVLANNYVYAPGLPHQLTFTFSEDVSGTLSTSALVVINLKTAAAVTPATYSYNTTTNVATFGFGTTSWLADGNYAVVLKGSLIADSSGNKLLGSDGIAGHDYVATSTSDNGLFWFLDADPNRDRSAGQDDMNVIAANYNTTAGYSQGDLNYDGHVNFTDLVHHAASAGETVPRLGAPGTPTQTAAGTDRMLISWPASADSTVTNYDVYRNWQRVATGVPGTSYLDTGLAANTSYTYAIVAKDGSGNTSFITVPLVASTAPAGALTVQPVINQTMDASGNLTFSTTFSDTGPAATHTASLTWGDGNSGSGTVTESNNSGTISGSHAYAGVGRTTPS